MDMYQKAYDCYCAACQSYGMESLNFTLFIKHLTREQIEEFLKQAIH